MYDMIAKKLKGTARDRERRSKLLAELMQALADGGPDAVTNALSGRFDTLSKGFDTQLSELKKQL